MESKTGLYYLTKSPNNYHSTPVSAIRQPRFVIQADAYDLYCEQFQFWTPPFSDDYKDDVPLLGPKSTLVTCPKCKEEVETIIKTKSTAKTHIFAFTMCMFLLWPFCLIPYCMKGCKARIHFCPKCNTCLGIHED